jgi:hypothetical protein
MNGKQRRVKRPATIEGMDVDEFILRNADPIWLHQNAMWEYIIPEESMEADANAGVWPIQVGECAEE